MKKKKQLHSYLFILILSIVIVVICLSIPVASQTTSTKSTSENQEQTLEQYAFNYYLPNLNTGDDVSIVFYNKNFQMIGEQKTPITKEPLEIKKTNNQIEVISRYNETNDLLLTLGKVSKNQTWQISNAYLMPLATKNPTDAFASRKNVLNNVYTDYVAPYHQLRALSHIDGDDPYSDDYTGGWHTYNEFIDTPTASSESIEVLADGHQYTDNKTFSAKELKVVVTNLVQAANTKKRNGTGRPVLREKISYTIVGGKITVELEATALEDITLKDYAFLQAATNDYNSSIFVPDDPLYPNEITNFTKDIWGSSRKNTTMDQIILSNTSNQLILAIDPSVGIGNYRANQTKSAWYYRSYGKVYFNPIDTEEYLPFHLAAGQKIRAKGYYQFLSCD